MARSPMTRRPAIVAVAATTAVLAAVVFTGGSSPDAVARPASPSGADTCSVWTVPTLETAPVAVAAPADGVPYVLLCVAADGTKEPARTVVFGPTDH